jgi:hypothetical protein
VEKQYKLEEQRRAEEKKNGNPEAPEPKDRRKVGRVSRWINYALGSIGG